MGPVELWQDEDALGELYEKIEGLGFRPEQITYANVDELKPHLALADLQHVGPYSFVKGMKAYAARVMQYADALRSLKFEIIEGKIENSEQLTKEQKLFALATYSNNNLTQFGALLKKAPNVDTLLKELHRIQRPVKHPTLQKISKILDYFTYC